MTNDKKIIIKYYKFLKKAKEIIESGNLSENNILKVNNLYAKADKLLLEINRVKNNKKSYSPEIIIGSIFGISATVAALVGGYLYYKNEKNKKILLKQTNKMIIDQYNKDHVENVKSILKREYNIDENSPDILDYVKRYDKIQESSSSYVNTNNFEKNLVITNENILEILIEKYHKLNDNIKFINCLSKYSFFDNEKNYNENINKISEILTKNYIINGFFDEEDIENAVNSLIKN